MLMAAILDFFSKWSFSIKLMSESESWWLT